MQEIYTINCLFRNTKCFTCLFTCLCACLCACVRVCVCACVRACVRACARVCVHYLLICTSGMCVHVQQRVIAFGKQMERRGQLLDGLDGYHTARLAAVDGIEAAEKKLCQVRIESDTIDYALVNGDALRVISIC